MAKKLDMVIQEMNIFEGYSDFKFGIKIGDRLSDMPEELFFYLLKRRVIERVLFGAISVSDVTSCKI